MELYFNKMKRHVEGSEDILIKESVIDDYQSFIWTEKYNDIGDFEICFDKAGMKYINFGPETAITIDGSDSVMIPLKTSISKDSENNEQIIISGKSFEYLLTTRVITSRNKFDGKLVDLISNLFNTYIGEYGMDETVHPWVDRNPRYIPYKFVPPSDEKINNIVVSGIYTGKTMYDVIEGYCKEFNLGFKTYYTKQLYNSGIFNFTLYNIEDRTINGELPMINFSFSHDNLLDCELEKNKENESTVFITESVYNESTTMRKYEKINPNFNTGFRRKESYKKYDGSDKITDDSGQSTTLPYEDFEYMVDQFAKKELASRKIEVVGNATVSKGVYKDDDKPYSIGNLVNVKMFDENIKGLIVSLVRSCSDGVVSIYPEFDFFN